MGGWWEGLAGQQAAGKGSPRPTGPEPVWGAGAGGEGREKQAWRKNEGPGSHLAPAASAARDCRAWRPRRTGRCESFGCRRREAPPQSLGVWGPSWGQAGKLRGARFPRRVAQKSFQVEAHAVSAPVRPLPRRRGGGTGGRGLSERRARCPRPPCACSVRNLAPEGPGAEQNPAGKTVRRSLLASSLHSSGARQAINS